MLPKWAIFLPTCKLSKYSESEEWHCTGSVAEISVCDLDNIIQSDHNRHPLDARACSRMYAARVRQGVLGHSGCCGKTAQTGSFTRSGKVFLPVCGLGVWAKLPAQRARALFWTGDSSCILTWWKGHGSSPGPVL